MDGKLSALPPGPRQWVGGLHAVERFQADVLRTIAPRLAEPDADEYDTFIPEVIALARRHGFEPLGCGSTRVAVQLGGPEHGPVAKVAYDFRGVMHNLHEAGFWLSLPDRIREHLAPCLLLMSHLVLVQEHVAVIGPPLTESLERDTQAERHAVLREHEDRIVELWAGIGFRGPIDVIRLDNFGLREGRVVAIDYAEKWRPVEAVTAWLLHRLKSVQSIELGERQRAKLYRHLARDGGESLSERRPTFLTLAARAGFVPDPGDRCPCGADTLFQECPRTCGLHTDATQFAAALALINDEAASSARPSHGPRTVWEAVGEGIAEAAGITTSAAQSSCLTA